MLPPFRIRHLKASDNPSGPDLGDDFLSSPIHGDDDAVIVISEPDYDSLVTSHPEAALTYLDEDDGEIITIGSAHELGQRLDEPASGISGPESLPRSSSPPFLYPSLARPVNPHVSPISAPMHVFDVDRSNGALDIWKRFIRSNGFQDQKTSLPVKGKQRAVESTKWEDGIPERPMHDLEVEVDDADNVSRARELSQERELDIEATIRSDTRSKASSAMSDSHELARETTPLLRKYSPLPEIAEDNSANLTPEGRRQAREAGEKLRSSLRNSLTSPQISSEGEKEVHRGRWASYGRVPCSFIKPTPLPASTVQLGDSEKRESRERPLLDVFEDELQKIMDLQVRPAVTDEKLPADQATLNATAASGQSSSIEVNDQHFAPGDLVANTLRSLVDGIGLLASDLRTSLTDEQDPLAKIPHTVHRALQSAFTGFGSHIQGLANAVQEASHVAKSAADRTREADIRALENTVRGLHSLATGVGEFTTGLFSGPPAKAVKVSSVHELLNNGECTTVKLDKEEESPKFSPLEGDGLDLSQRMLEKTSVSATGHMPTPYEVSAAIRSSVTSTAEAVRRQVEETRCAQPQLHTNMIEIAAAGTRGLINLADEATVAAVKLHQDAYKTAAAQARRTTEDARLLALNNAARARNATKRAAGVARREAIRSAMIARGFALQNARSVRDVISQNNGASGETSSTPADGVQADLSSKSKEREEAAQLAREDMSKRRKQLRRLAMKDVKPRFEHPKGDREFMREDSRGCFGPISAPIDIKGTQREQMSGYSDSVASAAANPGSDSEISSGGLYSGLYRNRKRASRDSLPYSRHPDSQHGRFYRPRHNLGYDYVSPTSEEHEELGVGATSGTRSSPGSPWREGSGRLDRRPLSLTLPRRTRSISPPLHRVCSPPRHSPPPGWPRFPRHGPIHLPHDLPRHPRGAPPPPPPPAPMFHSQYPLGQCFQSPSQSRIPHSPPLRHRQSWHPDAPAFDHSLWCSGEPRFEGVRSDEVRGAKSSAPFVEKPMVPSSAGFIEPPRRHFQDASSYSNGVPLPKENWLSRRWPGAWPTGDERQTLEMTDNPGTPHIRRKQMHVGETSDEEEVEVCCRKPRWGYERLGEDLDRLNETLDERNSRHTAETSALLKNDENLEECENDESLLLPRPTTSSRLWSVSPPPRPPILSVNDASLAQPEMEASPIPEMTRFPSLSQFEGSSFRTSQPFPALPSMATLTPQNRDSEVGLSLRSTNPFATPPPLAEQHGENDRPFANAIPGAWPPPLPPPPPPKPVALTRNDSEAGSPRSTPNVSSERLDQISRHQPILRAWLDDHLQNPYPTEAEELALQSQTGLTLNQISNWFTTSVGLLGLANPRVKPAGLSPAAPGARLAGPFDPLAISGILPGADHNQTVSGGLTRGLTRAATAATPTQDRYRRERSGVGLERRRTTRDGRPYWEGRPYSDHFTGNGRMGWSKFLDTYNKTPGGFPVDDDDHTEKNQGQDNASTHELNSVPPYSSPPFEWSAPIETENYPASIATSAGPIDEPMIDLEDRRENSEPEDPIQKCVNMLQTLGFGTKEDGGIERLSVYAAAADGDLEAALEIISEEKKAWEQRSGH